MSIRPYYSQDGVPRITVRVEHRFSLDRLAMILCAAVADEDLADILKLGPPKVRELIREQLRTHGLDIDGWADGLDYVETEYVRSACKVKTTLAFPELAELTGASRANARKDYL